MDINYQGTALSINQGKSSRREYMTDARDMSSSGAMPDRDSMWHFMPEAAIHPTRVSLPYIHPALDHLVGGFDFIPSDTVLAIMHFINLLILQTDENNAQW